SSAAHRPGRTQRGVGPQDGRSGAQRSGEWDVENCFTMNLSVTILELSVLALGRAVLLVDLCVPTARRGRLVYGAGAGVGVILWGSFRLSAGPVRFAFNHQYVLDGFALFFKRFFLLTAIIVLAMAVEFADRIRSGISEFYSLLLFALGGMMLAASANDFI